MDQQAHSHIVDGYVYSMPLCSGLVETEEAEERHWRAISRGLGRFRRLRSLLREILGLFGMLE